MLIPPRHNHSHIVESYVEEYLSYVSYPWSESDREEAATQKHKPSMKHLYAK